jgi:cyclophilin family peptidyl-prolyl cis-trans isomerase
MVRDFGWQSKSSNDIPTYTRTLNAFLNNEEPIVTELDIEQVNNAIKWVLSLSDDNNYYHNIKVIVEHGIVNDRTAPLAASIIKAFQNSKPKQIKESNYVGKIGDKTTFDLNFNKKFEFFSQFGTINMYCFSDENNNEFVWKTSKLVPFEENKKYLIFGTIKKHNLYKDKFKQTELTRCKVNNIY